MVNQNYQTSSVNKAKKKKAIIFVVLGILLLAGIVWLIIQDGKNKKGELNV